ncbi:MAG: DUF3343 domain-containing protein [Oscillospiraceae bacterium]
MQQYIIMCRSLTYAQRAMATLERSGITTAVSRAPRELSPQGCGYCLKVSQKRFNAALGILAAAGEPRGRLFRIEDNGEYTEVAG